MSSKKFVSAVVNTLPFGPMKGIYYIGQYGTSGYASAARGYLYHYFTLGIPIKWDPLYFDNSKMEDDDPYNIIVKSFINKPLPIYDVVIMHSTPDLWPKFRAEKANIMKGKIVIGYCTWETDKLPEDWVRCINNTVNEVWVPSTYNKKCFEASGVERVIRVVPHVFLNNTPPPRERFRLVDIENGDKLANNDVYTFYSIGELNARKGMDDVIKAFCESFTKKDKVRLILKVHYKDYSAENRLKCEEMLTELLSAYEDYPSVICLTENMTNRDIIALHSLGDCYISLTKSEGFGLTIFDAFNYRKKIIATGYSGHVDFLGTNYPGLVNYKLGPVEGMESQYYGSNQTWAYPDVEHAKYLMKNVIL